MKIGDYVITNELHSQEGRKLFGRDLRKILKPQKIIKITEIKQNNKLVMLENGRQFRDRFLEVVEKGGKPCEEKQN